MPIETQAWAKPDGPEQADMVLSEGPRITVENACGSVKVKFGGVTHINFRLDRFLGFQTWKQSDQHFCIEVKLVGGDICTEYDDREKWIAIIAGLDKAVAQ